MRVVHQAGDVQPSGLQTCELCSTIITTPGLSPMPKGPVEIVTVKGYGGKAVSTTDDAPTCVRVKH